MRNQIEIITGYHTSGTPYGCLINYQTIEDEMIAQVDNIDSPEEEEENRVYIRENNPRIDEIDDRRIDMLREPDSREALQDALLAHWSDNTDWIDTPTEYERIMNIVDDSLGVADVD